MISGARQIYERGGRDRPGSGAVVQRKYMAESGVRAEVVMVEVGVVVEEVARLMGQMGCASRGRMQLHRSEWDVERVEVEERWGRSKDVATRISTF